MTLGDVISAYRKEHRLSMEKFGELAGMSKAYVSMLERNRTQRGDEPSPSIEMYRNVAKAIGMDVDALIRQVDGNVSFDMAADEIQSDPTSIRQQIDDRDIKAAFFEGSGATDEEMDALWDDARDYIAYKLAQKRRKSDG